MITSESMKKVKFYLVYIQFYIVGKKRKSISPKSKELLRKKVESSLSL